MARRALGRASALPCGWLSHPLLASAGLFFCSRAQKLAILSLGHRTRLHIHLPLHAAMLALAMAHAPGLCQAALSQAGQGPAQVGCCSGCAGVGAPWQCGQCCSC